MKNIFKITIYLVSLMALLSGLASASSITHQSDLEEQYPSTNNQNVSADDRNHCYSRGIVREVKQIKRRDKQPGVGTVMGILAGILIANNITSGTATTLRDVTNAAMVSTVAAPAAGYAIDMSIRDSYYAWRFRVRTDNGSQRTIIQLDNPGIQVGDQVRLCYDYNRKKTRAY